MDNTQPTLPLLDLLQEAQISPEEARLALARSLFRDGRLSREEARVFSGDPAGFEATLFRDAERLDLDDFLDWASHDLKTPLNSIIGFSRVMLKGIDGPITETQQADLSTVYGNGQRLLNLISMMVDIARLNKGSLHMAPTHVNLAELLNETAARWKSQNSGRTLETEIELETGPLQLDAGRMRQLVSGALTYSALQVVEGGAVSLSTSQDEARVVILIASQGARDPAMPELERAMLPFINRSLARIQGGGLREAQNPEGGVSLEIWLPK